MSKAYVMIWGIFGWTLAISGTLKLQAIKHNVYEIRSNNVIIGTFQADKPTEAKFTIGKHWKIVEVKR